MEVRDRITEEIEGYTGQYRARNASVTAWGKPIVGFADAENPIFKAFKRVVSPAHLLPQDLLPSARTVVVFFLPFDRRVAESNIGTKLSSKAWAFAYVETNSLINALGEHMKIFLEAMGWRVKTTPPTHNYDREKLVSNWSHRHIAYAAGIGNFGLNNMLITKQGCCGRIGSFVMDQPITADQPMEEEACLYRHDSSCSQCVDRCVNAALFKDQFDRWKCSEMCMMNEHRAGEIGKSYVCGKCLVGLPCSFNDPVKGKSP